MTLCEEWPGQTSVELDVYGSAPVPVWLTPAAWPRHRHGRRDDRERSRHGRRPARPARDQQPRPPTRPPTDRTLGRPAQPPQPAPASGQLGSELRSSTPTTPLPGDPSAPPAFAAAGHPCEALAGFWRRLVSAFLDWILIGILAAAIGDLFGVEGPTPPVGRW